MVNKSTDINKTTQFEHEKLTTYGVGIQVLDMQKKVAVLNQLIVFQPSPLDNWIINVATIQISTCPVQTSQWILVVLWL